MMFAEKRYILSYMVLIVLLSGCSIPLTKIELEGYHQNYSLGDQKTVNVGSVMFSQINYKNSCYDYIALVDYETPTPGTLAAATIKKGNQYPACFQTPSNEKYVFIKGIHAYTHILLGIDKNGFIDDEGGWYNSNGGIRIFQLSWTKDRLFALSDKKYYPGFDSRNERFIYLGMMDGKVRIGYRVDNHNSSKPDESQDIVHDLRDGNAITYLNYTFKIVNADNTKITFVLENDK